MSCANSINFHVMSNPMFRTTMSSSSYSSSHQMHGQSLYPAIGEPAFPPHGPSSSFHHTSSSYPERGIRVSIKPEYWTPPPQFPLLRDIPRSNFEFDFELEMKILAEAENESQNWSNLGLENLFPATADSPSPSGSAMDPVVRKYLASGLSREAVPIAVANYGDNPTKVKEFVDGYHVLQEMGFSANNVAEALLMYDNDADKALAHFLGGSP
ncbi:hypothetical protein NMG60_11020219 [Bertholletia excelsa]